MTDVAATYEPRREHGLEPTGLPVLDQVLGGGVPRGMLEHARQRAGEAERLEEWLTALLIALQQQVDEGMLRLLANVRDPAWAFAWSGQRPPAPRSTTQEEQ